MMNPTGGSHSYNGEGDMPTAAGSSRGKSVKSRETPTQPAQLPQPTTAEWEMKQEMLQQELENARIRSAQMEKNMRWWSDCTTIWREKYSKVRSERNKAREMCRNLRSKLETFAKESATLKRQYQDIRQERDSLKLQLDECSVSDSKSQQQPTGDVHHQVDATSTTGGAAANTACSSSAIGGGGAGSGSGGGAGDSSTVSSSCYGSSTDNLPSTGDAAGVDKEDLHGAISAEGNSASAAPASNNNADFVDRLLSRNAPNMQRTGADGCERLDDSGGAQTSSAQDATDASTASQILALQTKLQEALKQLQSERRAKEQLGDSLDHLNNDLSALKGAHEELRQSQQDAISQVTKLKEYHKEELSRVEQDLSDETSTRVNMDKQLLDLRKELERLHSENASEWTRREQLETDKLALERESKKLRSEINDLQEEIDRKDQQNSQILDTDVKTLQKELDEKTKELLELRHAHSKLKKLLQDKTCELEYSQRRMEQSEQEIKKLRMRIDELKSQLAYAEDQADAQVNQTRKLQRSNEELQQQVDTLKVEVGHLGCRLRSTSNQHLSAIHLYDDSSSSDDDDDDDDIGAVGGVGDSVGSAPAMS